MNELTIWFWMVIGSIIGWIIQGAAMAFGVFLLVSWVS